AVCEQLARGHFRALAQRDRALAPDLQSCRASGTGPDRVVESEGNGKLGGAPRAARTAADLHRSLRRRQLDRDGTRHRNVGRRRRRSRLGRGRCAPAAAGEKKRRPGGACAPAIHASARSCKMGRTTVKMAPFPRLLATETRPCCSSQTRCTIGSPNTFAFQSCLVVKTGPMMLAPTPGSILS